ncbi:MULTISPECIES: hypothetical protein [Streptomyces]|uniref:hypothetical protein n=1 Tax=Streptomyces TaxID=1883 RepID=UPI0004CD49E3|nr:MULTISPECIES: hypothetical protein [Streptomyces]
MAVHLIAYTAQTATGPEARIGRVLSPRTRPSWKDCHEQLDGFLGGGTHLGLEPQYTLTWTAPDGTHAKTLSGTSSVEKVGTVVSRAADRGEVWGIAIHDEGGHDVTFNFTCFQN